MLISYKTNNEDFISYWNRARLVYWKTEELLLIANNTVFMENCLQISLRFCLMLIGVESNVYLDRKLVILLVIIGVDVDSQSTLFQLEIQFAATFRIQTYFWSVLQRTRQWWCFSVKQFFLQKSSRVLYLSFEIQLLEQNS